MSLISVFSIACGWGGSESLHKTLRLMRSSTSTRDVLEILILRSGASTGSGSGSGDALTLGLGVGSGSSIISDLASSISSQATSSITSCTFSGSDSTFCTNS